MSVETALSYAALILADSEIEISQEKLLNLVSEAKVEVEPIWADIFSKALEGKDLKEFFFNFSAAAAPVAVAGGEAAAASGEAAAEEKEEEAKEESDDDMGFGLFD